MSQIRAASGLHLRPSRPRLAWFSMLIAAIVLSGCGPERPTTDDNLAWATYRIQVNANARGYILRANIYEKRDMIPETIADLNSAYQLATAPHSEDAISHDELNDAIMRSSELHVQLHELDGALADLHRSYDLAPHGTFEDFLHALPLTDQVYLFIEMKRLSEADEAASSLLATGPGTPEFKMGMAAMAAVYAAR